MLTEEKGPLSLIPVGFSPHYKIKGRCFCTLTLEGVNPGHTATEIWHLLSFISLFHRWVHSVIIGFALKPVLHQTAKATNLQCIDLLISKVPSVRLAVKLQSFWIVGNIQINIQQRILFCLVFLGYKLSMYWNAQTVFFLMQLTWIWLDFCSSWNVKTLSVCDWNTSCCSNLNLGKTILFSNSSVVSTVWDPMINVRSVSRSDK